MDRGQLWRPFVAIVVSEENHVDGIWTCLITFSNSPSALSTQALRARGLDKRTLGTIDLTAFPTLP